MLSSEPRPTVGILALQGAFAEHAAVMKQLNVDVVLVRNIDDLNICHGLIIPGGESTTIAIVAMRSGLLEPLRTFVKEKPVWGTCAGAILLSKQVLDMKKGGQELLGGMSVSIQRNGWGSQIESFEADLIVDGLEDPARPFTGVFIRAPVIQKLIPGDDDSPIHVICRLSPHSLPESWHSVEDSIEADDPRTFVALRQGLHLLTTFHPELTTDGRFHAYFVKECVLPTLQCISPVSHPITGPNDSHRIESEGPYEAEEKLGSSLHKIYDGVDLCATCTEVGARLAVNDWGWPRSVVGTQTT